MRPIIPEARVFKGKKYEYHDTYWNETIATKMKANMIKKGYSCQLPHTKRGGYRLYIRKVR